MNHAQTRVCRNRFAGLRIAELNETEQTALVRLALSVLEIRHWPGQALPDVQSTCHFLRLRLGERRNEVFGALFLDHRHRVLCTQELFQGTLHSAAVYPRVVAQQALVCNAGAAIFYHNHPSGNPEPSAADTAITRTLQDVLALVEVRVLDHIVVGHGGAVSFAERGLL